MTDVSCLQTNTHYHIIAVNTAHATQPHIYGYNQNTARQSAPQTLLAAPIRQLLKNNYVRPTICQTERQVCRTRNDMAASGDKTATFNPLILDSYKIRGITYGHLPD